MTTFVGPLFFLQKQKPQCHEGHIKFVKLQRKKIVLKINAKIFPFAPPQALENCDVSYYHLNYEF